MISKNRFQEQISNWQVLSKNRSAHCKKVNVAKGAEVAAVAVADPVDAFKHIEIIKQHSLQEELAKREKEKIFKLLKKVPLRYQSKTWTDFKVDISDQAKIKSIMEYYVKTISDRMQDGNNILFYGKPGTGKTLLSLIVYQQLVQSGYPCCYEPSLDFLRFLQDKKFISNSDFFNSLKNYQDMPFLIIDEVTEGSGKEQQLTDWEKSLLFKLIDARYRRKCCTLIISNRTRLEIRTRLTEPTFDRLSESGLLLGFNWKSYRQ